MTHNVTLNGRQAQRQRQNNTVPREYSIDEYRSTVLHTKVVGDNVRGIWVKPMKECNKER